MSLPCKTGGRSPKLRILGAGLALVSLAGLVSCGTAESEPTPASHVPVPQSSAAAIDGVKFYDGLSSKHVTTQVTYPQSPAVGGDHSATWTTCGIYNEPVEQMRAVHSMEHGAVWVTYRPDLPAAQAKELRDLVGSQTYVLLSPYPGQESPVTVTAWGVQLTLDTSSDARLKSFLATYIQGRQTPEPGAPCTGGMMG